MWCRDKTKAERTQKVEPGIFTMPGKASKSGSGPSLRRALSKLWSGIQGAPRHPPGWAPSPLSASGAVSSIWAVGPLALQLWQSTYLFPPHRAEAPLVFPTGLCSCRCMMHGFCMKKTHHLCQPHAAVTVGHSLHSARTFLSSLQAFASAA